MFDPQPFERVKHVYRCDEFSELLKDAVRFFHGTPVCHFPPEERFVGAGVYALYYIGKTGLYAKFGQEINREEYRLPIYVGKAEPTGWRQSRKLLHGDMQAQLRQLVSLMRSGGLRQSHFAIRFVSADEIGAADVPRVAKALCNMYHPIWNRFVFQGSDDAIAERWRELHGKSDRVCGESTFRKRVRNCLECA